MTKSHNQTVQKFAITSKAKLHITPIIGIFSILVLLTVNMQAFSFAETQNTFRLNDELILQTSEVIMNVPEDNVMPWGSVRGNVNEPASGYPVIIQFFNEENGDIPIHVAQVDVNQDNSFEYKFRVRDVNLDTGEAINIFEGNYVVKIFKVINSPVEKEITI